MTQGAYNVKIEWACAFVVLKHLAWSFVVLTTVSEWVHFCWWSATNKEALYRVEENTKFLRNFNNQSVQRNVKEFHIFNACRI